MRVRYLCEIALMTVLAGPSVAWKVIRDDNGVFTRLGDRDRQEELQRLREAVSVVADELKSQIQTKIGPRVKTTFQQSDSGRRLSIDNAVAQALLDTHNTMRSDTAAGDTTGQPSATNMNKMHWDPALATVAQNYANGCHYEHNPNRNTEFQAIADEATFYYEAPASLSRSIGENIFASSNKDMDFEQGALFGMQLFFDEYVDYSYDEGSCSNVCGHYTQIVWAPSRYVGCGIASCDSLGGLGEDYENNGGLFMVCNYFQAQSSSWPYEKGSTCTNCPVDRKDNCNGDSLCGGCMATTVDACTDIYTSGCDSAWCGTNCDALGCSVDDENACTASCYGCYDTCSVSGCGAEAPTCCDDGKFCRG